MSKPQSASGRRTPWWLIAAIVLAAAIGIAVVVHVLGTGPGYGYGIDKSADRSHELAGVKDAAAKLRQRTNGGVAVDTSRASLVFAEEHDTVIARVRVGHCQVQGTFRNVPYNTNNALTARDVGPLYLTGHGGGGITLRVAGTGQLAVIRASSWVSRLTSSSATPTTGS